MRFRRRCQSYRTGHDSQGRTQATRLTFFKCKLTPCERGSFGVRILQQSSPQPIEIMRIDQSCDFLTRTPLNICIDDPTSQLDQTRDLGFCCCRSCGCQISRPCKLAVIQDLLQEFNRSDRTIAGNFRLSNLHQDGNRQDRCCCQFSCFRQLIDRQFRMCIFQRLASGPS